MTALTSILKSIAALSLIACLMNLGIVIWEANILFAEINEEIENVLEDESEVECISMSSAPKMERHSLWLKQYRSSHAEGFAYSHDYFEITSPPPEFVG